MPELSLLNASVNTLHIEKNYMKTNTIFSFGKWRKSGVGVADLRWEHNYPNFQVHHVLTTAHENFNNFLKCHEFKTYILTG